MYTTSNDASLRRIRSPHPHDVLSGRGGGINGHEGNVQFREWVRQRKNDYNLAPSKVEKAAIAQDVIRLVRSQNPPGRFLQKDATIGVGNWWIQLEEDRVVAKTSQALREGAPQIRAAHSKETDHHRKAPRRKGEKTSAPSNKPPKHRPMFSSVPSSLKKRGYDLMTGSWQTQSTSASGTGATRGDGGDVAYQEKAILELRANVEQARLRNDMLENDPIILEEKRLRLDEAGGTGSGPRVPPKNSFGQGQRQNSLALSEFSFDVGTESFVNPFSDEVENEIVTKETPSDKVKKELPSSIGVPMTIPQPLPLDRFMRANSSASNGDFGGLKSLTNPPPPSSLSRNKSEQSVMTEVSKPDWEEGDPLLTYLTSLDRGVRASS